MKIPTLINSSSKINGELIFTTDVRIDGEVFGKVESDKSVIIGAEGFVKGFLRAKDLFIFGRFEGNIIVSGMTILHENASVFGNLYTKEFEVKEGAKITARIVMYDKLEAIDEAQIYLAEEMIKIEPNKRKIPVYPHAKISFDEKKVDVKVEQIAHPFSLTNQLLEEQKTFYSDVAFAKIIEGNKESENSMNSEQHPQDGMVEKDTFISFSQELVTEMVKTEFHDEIEIEDSTLLIQKIQQNQQTEPGELLKSALAASESIPADSIDDTEELTFIDDFEFIDDEDPNLVTLSDELIENQPDEFYEAALTAVGSSAPEQNNILEFDFKYSLVENNEELVLFHLPKPISIAECLGEPVKEDFLIEKKGKKKLFRAESPTISQAIRKNKGGYNISGFEELRNLLIPGKYHQMKSAEKKSDQENYNGNKINELNNGTISKESEKGELFLNNAIRQLPDDDYSSLFN